MEQQAKLKEMNDDPAGETPSITTNRSPFRFKSRLLQAAFRCLTPFGSFQYIPGSSRHVRWQ